MTFSISPFLLENYEDVYSLWEQCEGIGLSDSDSLENTKTFLKRNPGMSFIATFNDRIIGAVLSGHDGRRGFVYHLAVHEDFRNQGIGRQLVEKCIAAFQDAGIKKCHIFIFNDNEKGIGFWNAVGWTFRSDISMISKNI